MYNKRNWLFGLLLIVYGTVIFLNKLDIIEVDFFEVIWPIVMLFGLLGVVSGFSERRNGKIFWGTCGFLFGLFLFIKSVETVNIPSAITLPIIIFIFGTALLMMYFNVIKEWFLLIFVFVFYIVGGAFLGSYFELFERWEVWENLRLYWPVVLILIGVAIILKRRSKTESHTL